MRRTRNTCMIVWQMISGVDSVASGNSDSCFRERLITVFLNYCSINNLKSIYKLLLFCTEMLTEKLNEQF